MSDEKAQTSEQARKQSGPRLVTRTFSDIASKRIKFIWPDRIPSKLTVLAGNPGCGKSQVSIAITATISTGGRWPDGTPCEKGSVIFIANEDDAGDTIKPRLEAAGADCNKVCIVDSVIGEDGKTTGWTLERGTDEIIDLCIKLEDVALIVIDPITAYIGGKDGHSTSDVRSVLAPLMDLADKHGIAILAISHLNKNSGGEAMTRITGSGAYVAAARAAFLVGDHPDIDGAQCMATLKTNLSPNKTAIGYKVVSVTTKDGIDTSRVEWLPGVIDIDADSLLMGKRDSIDLDANTAKSDAAAFLIDVLKQGPVKSTQVYEQADAAGIAESTLKRAKKALRIRSEKDSGSWLMCLPERKQEVQEVAPVNPDTLDTLGPLNDEEGQEVQEVQGSIDRQVEPLNHNLPDTAGCTGGFL